MAKQNAGFAAIAAYRKVIKHKHGSVSAGVWFGDHLAMVITTSRRLRKKKERQKPLLSHLYVALG